MQGNAVIAQRMRSITGRESRDGRTIKQTSATLERMLAECIQLGFIGHAVGPAVIRLEWPSSERARLGLAPLRFKVRLWGAREHGVYVREKYSFYPVHIELWGDWDLYIENCVCWF